jgi:hypothetical protein
VLTAIISSFLDSFNETVQKGADDGCKHSDSVRGKATAAAEKISHRTGKRLLQKSSALTGTARRQEGTDKEETKENGEQQEE